MEAIRSPQTPDGKRSHEALSPSQLHEQVNSFAKMKYEEAKTAYGNYRDRLLTELKSVDSPVDEEKIRSLLDECEERFADIYYYHRSGEIRDAFWAIESDRNEARRARAEQAELQLVHTQGLLVSQEVKQPRKPKVQQPPVDSKKRAPTTKTPTLTQNAVVANGISEKYRRGREHQSVQVVAVKNDRAVCIACGELVALTDDRKRWAAHRGKTRGICSPNMDRVEFDFIGGGIGVLRESSASAGLQKVEETRRRKKRKRSVTSKKARSMTAPETTKSVAPKKRVRVVPVSGNKATCPDCGRVVDFISRGRTLVSHVKQGSSSLCHPDYPNILFVIKKDKQKEKPGRKQNEGVAASKNSRSGLNQVEKRSAHRERKKMDRLTMRDPSYDFGLQDHDVEDSGRSVDAYHGGLPHSSRRFH